MTWTLDTSGTQTPTVGTEATLSTSTTNATFVYQVRLNNMVGGDIVELRVYTMTLTAGTLEQMWKATFGPAPPSNITVQSPPVASDQSIKVTLKQTAGTARAFDWKLLRI